MKRTQLVNTNPTGVSILNNPVLLAWLFGGFSCRIICVLIPRFTWLGLLRTSNLDMITTCKILER